MKLDLDKLEAVVMRSHIVNPWMMPKFDMEDPVMFRITSMNIDIVRLMGAYGCDHSRGVLVTRYVNALFQMVKLGFELNRDDELPETRKEKTIFTQFQHLFEMTAMLQFDDYYTNVWALLLGLGDMLGFTPEEVETAFMQRYGGGAA